MDLKNELQKIDKENELAETARKEAAAKAQEHLKQMQIAIVKQRQAFIAQWDKIISQLLTELGDTQWGEDCYTLIKPNGMTMSWYIIRAQGKDKLNFKVELIIDQQDPNNLSLKPDESLVQLINFKISGLQVFYCPLSADELKKSLVQVYKCGPATAGLDTWTEKQLSLCSYKKGEYDKTNYMITIPNSYAALFCFCSLCTTISESIQKLLVYYFRSDFGKGLLSAGLQGLAIIVAIAFFLIPVITLVKTKYGKRYTRLARREKIWIAISTIPGAILSFGILLIFTALLLAVILRGPAVSSSAYSLDFISKELFWIGNKLEK